ncbi:MAG TPA: M23 family metallopeptidase [Longimicrobium sp.]|jgi:murein DD-endopeptidase MepM/ murein hydrolase activator NlpD
MRSLRYLLTFTLGAVAMLATVLAVDRASPGTLDRVRVALGPKESAPAPTAPVAVPGVAQPAPPAPVPGVELPVVVAPTAVGALGLMIPVQGVPAAKLVDTYDQARGQGRRHDAIDIMAAQGTPVVAVSDGVVMKLFQSERGGITLYQLAPDRRTIYYYAHLDHYAAGIAEGRPLRRGQLLGYVGNTGDAGPGNYHLHFEVSTTKDPAKYWGGVAQNPYPLLR